MEGQSPAPTAAGSLAKTPFPHLLVYALERRLSGTFVLSVENAPLASMVVIQGCPSKVHTNVAVHQLGTVLADLGMITQEQLSASLERAGDDHRMQGQVLVEMGAIDAGQLETGLKLQVERKVEHLFALSSEASFAYYDGVDLVPAVGGPQVPIDPFPAMWRGVRHTPSWEHVDATLQHISGAMIRPSAIAQFERFGFGAQEMKAVERLQDRPARVVEITSILGPAAGQILVYLLTIMKQVELVEASQVAPIPAPPSPPPVPAPPVPPSSQSVSRPSGASAIGVPATGQAFARVQLQRQVARPLVVEEQVTRTYDSRASHPDLRDVAAAVRDRLAAKDATSGAPPPPASAEAPAADIASMISESVVAEPAEASAPAGASGPAEPVVTPGPAAPVAAVPPALTPEQAALRAKILQRAEEISSQDYFQMLGVARDASTDAVQKAFIALAKTWHPDRLPPALADVKDACGRVFSHLTEANGTLTDAAKRQDYMTLLKDGGATPDDQAKIQAILEAATEFQKAEILMKRSPKDPQAYELVKRCVELDDHQTDYVATLAWLEAQRPEWQGAAKTMEKVAILDRCIERSPNSERALFYRAMLLKRADQPSRALKDFKRVSEINPKNLDAMREVRLHNMRSGAEKKPGPPQGAPPDRKNSGLLGKLFKK
jgi:DnaJ-domain-containing protein 1